MILHTVVYCSHPTVIVAIYEPQMQTNCQCQTNSSITSNISILTGWAGCALVPKANLWNKWYRIRYYTGYIPKHRCQSTKETQNNDRKPAKNQLSVIICSLATSGLIRKGCRYSKQIHTHQILACLRPRCVNAEHSKYFTARIFDAILSPCSRFTGERLAFDS